MKVFLGSVMEVVYLLACCRCLHIFLVRLSVGKGVPFWEMFLSMDVYSFMSLVLIQVCPFQGIVPKGGGGYLGMFRWPLRAPPPSIKVYYVANYRPHLIIVTFEQICNFRDTNLVTFHFDELTHFLD